MEKIKKALTQTTLKILKPLIRLLIKNGVSQKEFDEIARRAFVEVGFNDFQIEGTKQTISRVSVITGLNRKEVLRIQRLADKEAWPEAIPLNRAARVISGWLRDSEFLDAEGQPKLIPRQGKKSSFASLVKRYSGDITPGAILKELIRVGAVEIEGDLLRLCGKGYIPKHGEEEKARIMGVSVSDLLSTIEHNIMLKEEDPWFQREVIYRNVPDPIVEEFKILSQKKANSLLLELNDWLSQKKESAEIKEGEGKRIGLGIYYFESKKKGQ